MTTTSVRSTVLPHTGMTVPHTDLKLVNLKTLPTIDECGEAFSADLTLHGERVGRIENQGYGGPTTWYPVNQAVFTHKDMETYVDGCSDPQSPGEPISEEFVLDQLFEETVAAEEVRKYLEADRTPLRALRGTYDDGNVVSTYVSTYYGADGVIWAAESRRADLATWIWKAVEGHDDFRLIVGIQVWTGTAWENLARPDGQAT